MVCVYDGRFSNRHRAPTAAVAEAPSAAAIEAELAEARAEIARLQVALRQERFRCQVRDRALARIKRLRPGGRRDAVALQAAARIKRTRPDTLAGQRRAMAQIIDAVAQVAGITPVEIRSRRRRVALSRPRQMAYWLVRDSLELMSWPDIGAAMNKDHTTVMHGVRVIDRLLREGDAATHALLEACRPAVAAVLWRMRGPCDGAQGRQAQDEALRQAQDEVGDGEG